MEKLANQEGGAEALQTLVDKLKAGELPPRPEEASTAAGSEMAASEAAASEAEGSEARSVAETRDTERSVDQQ